jgi:hypothetical protein
MFQKVPSSRTRPDTVRPELVAPFQRPSAVLALVLVFVVVELLSVAGHDATHEPLQPEIMPHAATRSPIDAANRVGSYAESLETPFIYLFLS